MQFPSASLSVLSRTPCAGLSAPLPSHPPPAVTPQCPALSESGCWHTSRGTTPTDFLSTSNFSLPGGGKGTRKRSPPPGSLTNSGKRQHRTTPSTCGKGSPRRVAVKSQRQDASAPSRATRKPKLSQISDASTPSEFTLTPFQSPGPTRSLSDLRVDPRIPNDGRPVGIGKTLLPFDGEGLFSLEENFVATQTLPHPSHRPMCLPIQHAPFPSPHTALQPS